MENTRLTDFRFFTACLDPAVPELAELAPLAEEGRIDEAKRLFAAYVRRTLDPERYLKICHPKFGRGSWQAVIDFAESCKLYVPDVVMTIVDSPVTTPEEQAKCRAITDRIGVCLRIRAYENPGAKPSASAR